MKDLRRRARRFVAAQAARDAALAELLEACRGTHRGGRPNRSEIIKAAGVSRPHRLRRPQAEGDLMGCHVVFRRAHDVPPAQRQPAWVE